MEALKILKEIDDYSDKLGEIVYDTFNEVDNFTSDVGKSIVSVFNGCETEREFKIANDMLIAICGWSLYSLIVKIKKRDEDNYFWESI